MRYLSVTLMLLAIAAAGDVRIVEEDGNQVLVEQTRTDGSVSRYWTSRQAFDQRAECEKRRQATRRHQCDAKLENLQRALENLRATEAGAAADCSIEEEAGRWELCEQLRQANQQ